MLPYLSPLMVYILVEEWSLAPGYKTTSEKYPSRFIPIG